MDPELAKAVDEQQAKWRRLYRTWWIGQQLKEFDRQFWVGRLPVIHGVEPKEEE